MQRGGRRVTLIEADDVPRGASYGNAGHIAVEQVAPLASVATLRNAAQRLFVRGGALSLPPRAIRDWLPFALRFARASTPARFASGRAALGDLLGDAIPAWERLLHAVDAPHLLRAEGHLIAWESPATAAIGRAVWMEADTGTARVRDADGADIRLLRALTGDRVIDAVRVDGSAQIADISALLERLRAAFVAAGGTLVRHKARSLVPQPGGIAVDAVGMFGNVIVAAGVASGGLLRPLGYRVPIIAERGYHLQAPVAASAWPTETPPIVFEDRSMIVTRFAGGLRAASFIEFTRADARPDPRKWRRLHDHAAALGLPIGEDAERWVGARPTLPDYLPAIGRSERHPGLYYAFGHQHLGLTLAAVTGERVAAMLRGERADARFALARFGGRRGLG
ncbi:FAD-binding oxidoreductase [Sphingomonas baiyangensis]|uniref:FAD-binding oxidoreductase n=2 Tax=Sphingomonas baiyangensis TaxID=2572576 RepID=A0A4U1L7R6_9SPHN|nr:FAD-binding oxidoreductase [Sphingomonas baiyangensis]